MDKAKRIENRSVLHPHAWEDGDLSFLELISQAYTNCKFSAGLVHGHPVDTMYLQAEKDGEITTQLLLRPDEMAAIGYVAAGMGWVALLEAKEKSHV